MRRLLIKRRKLGSARQHLCELFLQMLDPVIALRGSEGLRVLFQRRLEPQLTLRKPIEHGGVVAASGGQLLRAAAYIIKVAAERDQRLSRDDAAEYFPAAVHRALHALVDSFEALPVLSDHAA